ncbi:MAG: hypothetical protein ABEJ28_07415 [Salinigranum sp.]
MKVGLCVLALLVGVSLLNTGHALDGFVPKHVAVAYQASRTGALPNNDLVHQIPGFYSFAAILFSVLKIRPLALMHFPIQLVPYLAGFFALVYLVSDGNVVLAGLLTGLQFFLNTSATTRMFLWPHGLGFVLFFSLSVAFLALFRKRLGYRVLPLVLVCSIAIVYLSYNVTSIYLLLLGATYVIVQSQTLALHRFVNAATTLERRSLKVVVLVTAVVTGAFVLTSDFVSDTFLPLLATGFDSSNLRRFVATWIGGSAGGGTSEVSHLLVPTPDAIRYLALFRYFLVFVALVLFTVYVLYKVWSSDRIVSDDVLLVAFLCALVCYFVLRLYIGSIAIGLFYVPGVLSLAYVYSRVDDPRVAASAVIIIVLVAGSVVGTQMVNNRAGQIDRNLDTAYHVNGERQWIQRYGTPERPAVSDEYTTNLLVFGTMRKGKHPSYREASERFGLIEEAQAAALTTYRDPPGSPYFVLNTRESSMSLENWLIIESWTRHANELKDNPHADKLYADGRSWIYR